MVSLPSYRVKIENRKTVHKTKGLNWNVNGIQRNPIILNEINK